METVLITGGSGLIGKRLAKKLEERGYNVSVLGRSRSKGLQFPHYHWDIDNNEIDEEAIASADYIIHLAGAGIGDKRWTSKRKQQIIDSRIKSATLLFDEVRKQNKKLKGFISSSAIGYYGAKTSDKIFVETDAPADDFLGQICLEWEQAADRFLELGIRTAKIRTGVVLTQQGGALAKMSIPVKTGFGSAIGSGKQFIPWIHIDDLCGIYLKAIEDIKMHGSFNAVAPEHLTNKAFTMALARLFNKSLWFPNIPAFFMRILFGKMADILLTGSRVSADKIQEAGYTFQFPDIESALKRLLNQHK